MNMLGCLIPFQVIYINSAHGICFIFKAKQKYIFHIHGTADKFHRLCQQLIPFIEYIQHFKYLW